MRHISQMVGEDGRKPIERLRRVQLWKIADSLGLSYPVGAPKTVMVALLEANEVDVTQPIAGIQWQTVNGKASDGRNNQELYPVAPVHASERNGVNADAVVAQRLSAKEQEDAEFERKRMEVLERDNERLKSLEDENTRLKEIIEKRLAALETEQKEENQPACNKMGYWDVYKKAQSMGLHVHRKMKLKEIESLIASVEQ